MNLDLGYKKNILYSDVCIAMPKNGIISFIGDNGSGKSTLYKTILGFIPPIRGNLPDDIINKAAIVSDYVNIPEETTVKVILNLLGLIKVAYAKENYIDLHNYILDLKNCKISKLSSGQKRLVEIYTTLASGKKIIILDEAANSLDFKNRKLFLTQIKSLSENKVLFLHTSHELEDVIYLGGQVYGLFKEQKQIKPYKGDCTIEKLRDFLDCEVF